jgi:hypothetical protein
MYVVVPAAKFFRVRTEAAGRVVVRSVAFTAVSIRPATDRVDDKAVFLLVSAGAYQLSQPGLAGAAVERFAIQNLVLSGGLEPNGYQRIRRTIVGTEAAAYAFVRALGTPGRLEHYARG